MPSQGRPAGSLAANGVICSVVGFSTEEYGTTEPTEQAIRGWGARTTHEIIGLERGHLFCGRIQHGVDGDTEATESNHFLEFLSDYRLLSFRGLRVSVLFRATPATERRFARGPTRTTPPVRSRQRH